MFELGVGAGLLAFLWNLLAAVIILVVGYIVITLIRSAVGRGLAKSKLDSTMHPFILKCVSIFLWIFVILMVLQRLGVNTASVIAVLGAAGVAIGLALQGALSNIAGGVMLLFFRPFNVGDYVSAAGAEGIVKDITLFYTTIVTVDNKRITVPNSQVMNAVVTNFSSEELRRVDLNFGVAKSESPAEVQALMLDAIKTTPKVLLNPEPFARLIGGDEKQMTFQARAWCKSADYWDVYFDLTQRITEAMGAKGVKAPAARIVQG